MLNYPETILNKIVNDKIHLNHKVFNEQFTYIIHNF